MARHRSTAGPFVSAVQSAFPPGPRGDTARLVSTARHPGFLVGMMSQHSARFAQGRSNAAYPVLSVPPFCESSLFHNVTGYPPSRTSVKRSIRVFTFGLLRVGSVEAGGRATTVSGPIGEGRGGAHEFRHGNKQPRPEDVVLGRPPEGAVSVGLPPLGAGKSEDLIGDTVSPTPCRLNPSMTPKAVHSDRRGSRRKARRIARSSSGLTARGRGISW